MTPREAKTAIRTGKTKILDAKSGARGWILGPFICLWFSAFDRYGPMLFGLIASDNLGTRIHGRAGSDLNGVAMFTAIFPLMGWLVYKLISLEQASLGQLLIIAIVFLVGGPLVYWFGHSQRKEAEPLVRFLRKAVGENAPSAIAGTSKSHIFDGLSLILGGDRLEGPVTQDGIHNALNRVGDGEYLVIESDQQNYIQTASRDGTYILEVRKGGPHAHYRAIRTQPSSASQVSSADAFTFEEVLEAISSHFAGIPLPNYLELVEMRIAN